MESKNKNVLSDTASNNAKSDETHSIQSQMDQMAPNNGNIHEHSVNIMIENNNNSSQEALTDKNMDNNLKENANEEDIIDEYNNEINNNDDNDIEVNNIDDIDIEDDDNDENNLDINLNIKFLIQQDILCKLCKKPFTLDFVFSNIKYLTAECPCRLIKNIKLKKFFDEEVIDREKKNKKIFIYYCKDCETHLTESALEAKSNFYNDSGLIKKHETHELINLFNIKNAIEKEKKILKKIPHNQDEDKILFKNIMSCILNHYFENPNIHHYKTIKRFIKEYKNFKKISVQEEELKQEILYKISSLEELKKKFSDSSFEDKIYAIELNEYKNKMENLLIFKERNLNNLKFLSLINIQLRDISSLLTCSLKNLTNLG